MALRQIRFKDDEVLSKKCKEVKKFDEKLWTLLDDMYDTMRKADGVGLAAPQVGILKRVCVIEVENIKYELINPEIIETKGTVNDIEGCLSFPEIFGEVERPKYVKVKAYDRNGDEFMLDGSDLLARAICHECDHLDGVVFISRVTKFIER